MAVSRAKYKRLTDLYVVGTEVVLPDDGILWMQALNPLQRDEAQHDAQLAQARLVMALKGKHGTDERVKIEGAFLTDGQSGAVDILVDSKLGEGLMRIIEAIQDDPEWTERLEITNRSSDIMSRAPEDAERKLLDEINTDYVLEVQRRQDDERAWLRRKYEAMTEPELVDEYIDYYITRRGGALAMAEFNLTELWYGARACEAVEADGAWSHAACEGHQVQVFESKADVRALPEELQDLLLSAMQTVNMSVREAKNSARQGSSSVSSPLPSAPVESTPSTPTAILSTVPGT